MNIAPGHGQNFRSSVSAAESSPAMKTSAELRRFFVPQKKKGDNFNGLTSHHYWLTYTSGHTIQYRANYYPKNTRTFSKYHFAEFVQIRLVQKRINVESWKSWRKHVFQPGRRFGCMRILLSCWVGIGRRLPSRWQRPRTSSAKMIFFVWKFGHFLVVVAIIHASLYRDDVWQLVLPPEVAELR